jgi:hypothetical protein
MEKETDIHTYIQTETIKGKTEGKKDKERFGERRRKVRKEGKGTIGKTNIREE